MSAEPQNLEIRPPLSEAKSPQREKTSLFLAYQEKAMRFLESKGYVERDEEGRIICDLEKFKSKHEGDFFGQKMGQIYTSRKFGRDLLTLAFYQTFKDKLVYSREDYARLKAGQKVKPKPLFYVPENKKAATNINKIRQSDFYMGMWELGERSALPHSYPTQEDEVESGLSTQEAIIACLIYHPKYGNGERGEDGILKVNFNPEYVAKRYKKGDIRRKMSFAFFDSWRYGGGPAERYEYKGKSGAVLAGSLLKSSPTRFFIERCPNLTEEGLVRPYSDFRVEHSEDKPIGVSLGRISSHGLTTIGFTPETRRRYILGNEYASNGHVSYPISEKYAAILKEDEGGYELKSIFELKQGDLSEKELDDLRNARLFVRKSDIHFIDPSNLSELSVEDGALITNFKDFLDFSTKTYQEARFSLMELSVKEKAMATALYLHYGKDPRLWDFIRKYQISGLCSLMAVEQSKQNAPDIWELGERIGASKLFGEVSDIVQTVSKYQDSIRNTLSEEERQGADNVAQVILRETSKYLLAALPVLREDRQIKGVISIGDVERAISSLRDQVLKTYSNKYGMQINDNLYTRVLSVYDRAGTGLNVQAVAQAMLQSQWLSEANKEDSNSIRLVSAATEAFYKNNDELFESANETTGDTEKQLDHFRRFIAQENIAGRSPNLTIDVGSGEGTRITRPMSEMLSGTVIGVDRLPPAIASENNLHFAQGDFTRLPFRPSSADLLTAHWSVVNDLTTRSMQMGSLGEVARVLKVGGKFYFDVPYLEGEGGWDSAARQYHAINPESSYGMIRATFPGNKTKEFYIYPEQELNALLQNAGFELEQSDVWYTESGMPRRTVVAKLINKATPFRLEA